MTCLVEVLLLIEFLVVTLSSYYLAQVQAFLLVYLAYQVLQVPFLASQVLLVACSGCQVAFWNSYLAFHPLGQVTLVGGEGLQVHLNLIFQADPHLTFVPG